MSKRFKKKIKNKGILFWMEGFSGSGKTTISKNIFKELSKIFGPTILIQGNDIRDLLKLEGFTKKQRIKNSHNSSDLLKFILDQNINIIYTCVCLNDKARNIYKKKIKNFFQIYVKSDIQKILKNKKKQIIYKSKTNIVGLNIKAEYPKKPLITIENNFKKNLNKLSNELLNRIKLYK